MVHLSVAVARFVEALLYAILRIAGMTTLAALGAVIALYLLFRIWRRYRGRR